MWWIFIISTSLSSGESRSTNRVAYICKPCHNRGTKGYFVDGSVRIQIEIQIYERHNECVISYICRIIGWKLVRIRWTSCADDVRDLEINKLPRPKTSTITTTRNYCHLVEICKTTRRLEEKKNILLQTGWAIVPSKGAFISQHWIKD